MFKQLSIKLVKRMIFLPLILSAILLCKATLVIWSTLAKRFLLDFFCFPSLLLCVFCSVSIIAAHRGGHGCRDCDLYLFTDKVCRDLDFGEAVLQEATMHLSLSLSERR